MNRWIWTGAVAIFSGTMDASEFVDHALSPNRTADQTYTVELLIEKVRSRVDREDWDAVMKRSDERKKPGYTPGYPQNLLAVAGAELEKEKWISLQRIDQSQRPVRVLDAVGCLRQLKSLFFRGNEVVDLTPLRACRQLRELDVSSNRVQDLSALEGLSELEELSLSGNPVSSFSVLEALPNLKVLQISSDQIPAFKKVKALAHLRKLEIDGSIESFRELPSMPALRGIRGSTVNDLAGLERFSNLENLVNFFGPFESLQPLAGLKHLTHFNLSSSKVTDLRPLAGLYALREIWLGTDAVLADLSPLEGLPVLHKATLKQDGKEHSGLENIRSQLTDWDVEFLADKPRHVPSLAIEVVSQEEFDRYDVREPYGMLSTDGNEGLLESEVDWLDQKIEEVFAIDFKEDEDFVIPFQWGGARSRTVMLMSEKADEAFPRLALGIQQVLARAKHDWIIYFQSETMLLMVWVYPDKIVVTPEHADTIRKLVQPR